jgi:DNA repair exonuclease SbcCD ATPase subunit
MGLKYKPNNKTMKQEIKIIILLSGVLTASCSHVDYDSDEGAKKHLDNLIKNVIPIKKEKVEEHKSEIDYNISVQNILGENNRYLSKEVQEKREEIKEVLHEIYKDPNATHSIYEGLLKGVIIKRAKPATCKVCNRTVDITPEKFYEIAKKYNTGWTEWVAYKWFLWWKWDHRTDSFEFHKCPDCILQKDINRFQQKIYENMEEIAKTEAEIVKAKLSLREAESSLQESKTSYETSLRQSNRKIEIKRESNKAKQEAEKWFKESEELKNQLEKKEKLYQEQQKQEKISMAKKMLERMDINLVIEITGLSREDVERIARSNRADTGSN